MSILSSLYVHLDRQSSWVKCMSKSTEVISAAEWTHLGKSLALSPRQVQICQSLLVGMADKQIATKLRIGLPTVRTHMDRLFAKLKTRDRGQVLLHILREHRRIFCSRCTCRQ